MLDSVAKFAAWCLRLEPSATPSALPPTRPQPDPAPRPRRAPRRRRSQPLASLMARARAPRSTAQLRIALAARRAALAPPRPMASARLPTKRTPRPRHVWLEPRAPDHSVTRAALILSAPARERTSPRSLLLAA
jgi:hypothetical protein